MFEKSKPHIARCFGGYLAAVCAASLALGTGSASSETLEKLKAEASVKIAIGNEPPWTELKPDGTLTGAGPDIDRAILEGMGLKKFEGVIMEYGAMIPGLQARRVNLVSSGGLSIRPDRCQQVIFSNPIICTGTAFLTKKALLGKAKTLQAVADNGLRIAVCSGCVEEKFATEKGIPRDRIVNFPDGPSAVKILQDGRVDVVALPDSAILNLQKKAGDESLAIVLPVTDVPIGCAGAAFNKDDVEIRDAYDAGLAKLIADGRYAELMNKYGLEANARMLGFKTREQLCTP